MTRTSDSVFPKRRNRDWALVGPLVRSISKSVRAANSVQVRGEAIVGVDVMGELVLMMVEI